MAAGHFQLLMTFLSKTRETTLSQLFDEPTNNERPKINTFLRVTESTNSRVTNY